MTRKSKPTDTPMERQFVEIESFYHKDHEGVWYYWRPLFENKPGQWYTKLTGHKELPTVPFSFKFKTGVIKSKETKK